MSLRSDIESRFTQAMKSRDAEALSVYRMLKASLKNKEIEKQKTELTDEEIVEVVSRELKKLKDSQSDFEKADRKDLVEQVAKEIDILSQFMPEQMSEEDIRSLIDAKASELGVSGPSDFGKLMGAIMKDLKGKADGTVVTTIVKEKLSGS